ncbi:MAG: hypothetical protein NT144_08065 [Bacteroidia bacterium]|nr:hypothetical protein [Bacteroidia bacterium]
MKISKKFKLAILVFFMTSYCLIINAQDTLKVNPQPVRTFVITKNDGTDYYGIIISQDDREVLLETKEIGRLYIPKHEIKSIRELTISDLKSGAILGNNMFASRYFLTTNGLRMSKGDCYALFNWWGPDIQYAVSAGLTVGAMSTWFAVPIVLTAKTTFSANESLHFGLGVLAGTLSWADWGTVGALPYCTMTLGNSTNNINITGGYAMISGNPGNDNGNLHTTNTSISESAPLLSFGCLFRITKKVSFVGDSFIYMKKPSFSIIVPGIRVSSKPNRAFQFGFAGISADGKMTPIPMPMLSWFIRI